MATKYCRPFFRHSIIRLYKRSFKALIRQVRIDYTTKGKILLTLVPNNINFCPIKVCEKNCMLLPKNWDISFRQLRDDAIIYLLGHKGWYFKSIFYLQILLGHLEMNKLFFSLQILTTIVTFQIVVLQAIIDTFAPLTPSTKVSSNSSARIIWFFFNWRYVMFYISTISFHSRIILL